MGGQKPLKADPVLGVDPMLPIGPFRDFLHEQRFHYGDWQTLAEALATALPLNGGRKGSRALYRVLYEQKKVRLSFVDHCCVLLGAHIDDVYPYDEEQQAA